MEKTAVQLADRALVLLGVSARRPSALVSATTKTSGNVADRVLGLLGISAQRPSIPVSVATKASADVANRVLEKLMVIGEGDSPSASESAKITDLIRPVFDSLQQRGIITIADQEAIPNAYFELVCDVIAFAAAPTWGKASDALAALATQAETILLTFSQSDKIVALLRPIFDDLDQRGVITIADIDAIPNPYFEPICHLVAMAAAPTLGKPVDAVLTGLATRAEALLLVFSRIVRLDDMVVGFVEDLNAQDIAYVADPDAIPIEIFEAMARLLALNAAPIFDKPRDEVEIELAENKLRRVRWKREEDNRLQFDPGITGRYRLNGRRFS